MANVTKFNLPDAISEAANALGYTKKAVEEITNDVLGRMCDHIRMGERVHFHGLGIVSTHVRAARKGRNPKTGESINIPAKSVRRFKFAKGVK